jgi:BirA family biotin operon repressor/biotin-[acetyl-CoA-carboxylase] ligase
MTKQLAYHNVFEFEEVNSTNMVAEMLIAQGKPLEGSVISARFQRGGQGMGKNFWESRTGENLLMSIIVYPTFIRPDQQFLLNKISSMAVMDTVMYFIMPEGISIKWPNDIYAGQGKISGILIKNVISGNKITSSIIGIGLNVNQVDFSNQIPNPVSMKMITDKTFNIIKVRKQLCAYFDHYYSLLCRGMFEEIDKLYLHALLNHNVEARYRVSNETFTGIIEGVTEFGRLQVKHGSRLREFDIKEIEYLW